MELHVRRLAYLNLAVAGLGLLAAVVLLALAVEPSGWWTRLDEGETALSVANLLEAGACLYFLVTSPLFLFVGAGLLKLRPWAQPAAVAASILHMVNFPLGTAVGLYGLWAMNEPEIVLLFAHRRGGPA